MAREEGSVLTEVGALASYLCLLPGPSSPELSVVKIFPKIFLEEKQEKKKIKTEEINYLEITLFL